MNRPETLATIENWLLCEAPGCTDLSEFTRKLGQLMHAEGLLFEHILIHPFVVQTIPYTILVKYERVTDTVRERETKNGRGTDADSFDQSPMDHIVSEKQILRTRLLDSEDSSIEDLNKLKSEGFTDFIAIPIVVAGTVRAGFMVATKQPHGFSDQDLHVLHGMRIPLGPVLLLLIQRFEHRSVLRTYLGSDAGDRVWHGQTHRGDSETLEAAIFFCDLRGFTELSGQLDRNRLLDLINDVFAHLVACIAAHEGQVLKFMGDGLLATFVDKHGQPMCGPALNAASDAIAAIETLRALRNDEGKQTPRVGIGLHVGEVLYGNIGAPGRLDFTVIGNAVNQTARIEGLCEKVGRPILMSEEFATAMDFRDFPCGEYDVKGFEHPICVFGLAK